MKKNLEMAKVYEVRFQMTVETLKMQYDTTWLQEACVQSFLIARLWHSKAVLQEMVLASLLPSVTPGTVMHVLLCAASA